jgi:hypothetical protein
MMWLVIILLLSGCATQYTFQDKIRVDQRKALIICIQRDRHAHWPNVVYYHDGIPPQCRVYIR